MRALSLVLGLLTAAAAPAAALPPPLPIAVTVVSPHGPDHFIHANHYAALVPALAGDNWFALHTPTTPDARAAMACASWDEPDREACLRSLPRTGGSAPSIVLLIVPEGTIKVRATCIGPGARPTDPDRQSVEIDYKRLLFADADGRRADREALAGCIIAARAEEPAPPGPRPFRAADDAAWSKVLAELHRLRRLARSHAEFLALMPTADPTPSRHALDLIGNGLFDQIPMPVDFDPTEPATADQRRWQCLMDLTMQTAMEVSTARMGGGAMAEGAMRDLQSTDLREPRPGCIGVVAEAGDPAAAIRTVDVTHVGVPAGRDSPCLYQGTLAGVERGPGTAGDRSSFELACAARGGDDGHGPYRVRLDGAGAVLSAERLGLRDR